MDDQRDNTDKEDPGTDSPKGSIFAKTIQWIKKTLPLNLSNQNTGLREALEELIEEDSHNKNAQSSVAAHERHLISNILQLRDLSVVDIMVPRADIVAVDVDTSQDTLYRLMAEKPQNRLPVYKGDLDNIVGVIHMKDLIVHVAENKEFNIYNTMRDALVVSPSMRVMDLLLQMRGSRVHIAFVVDEFGGIDGLITINDLIESIVGEINDEFDLEITPQLIERPDGSIIADARFSIKDFEKRYGSILTKEEEEEELDTMGGLVSSITGHLPTRGEVIKHSSGIEFTILDADPRRIMRVGIQNLPNKKSPDDAQ